VPSSAGIDHGFDETHMAFLFLGLREKMLRKLRQTLPGVYIG
jgi:hypothetical protein